MLFEMFTKEFDHLQYIPVLQRMYNTNRVDEIQRYASYSQVERFRKELETLRAFGLHKELDIRVDSSQGEPTAARKMADGKVDTIFSVSNARIRETYRNQRNRKRYRRKIRNAFMESTVFKSNQTLSYDAHHIPLCFNCGAQMEADSENYYCPYCESRYKAEAYDYRLARFFIVGAFRDLRYLFLFLPVIVVVAVLQEKGMITERNIEIFSYAAAVLLLLLFFFALVKALIAWIRHRRALHHVRGHDPHFSSEIFTMHLIDLLTTQPEILLTDKQLIKGSYGVICRNLPYLTFCRYERRNDLEILECRAKVDALFLSGSSRRARLRDRRKKITVRMARLYGTVTPVHYLPDQFTCRNCGGHQVRTHAGTQVCLYCQTKYPMEGLDWIFYQQRAVKS